MMKFSILETFCFWTSKLTPRRQMSPHCYWFLPMRMIKWVCSHTYPDKSRGRWKWPSAITKLRAHFTRGIMSAAVNCKKREKCGHTWYRMFLLGSGINKQTWNLILRHCVIGFSVYNPLDGSFHVPAVKVPHVPSMFSPHTVSRNRNVVKPVGSEETTHSGDVMVWLFY